MFNQIKSVACGFLFYLSHAVFIFRQTGIVGRCFLDIYSLALKNRRTASLSFGASRSGNLAQFQSDSFKFFVFCSQGSNSICISL